MNIRNKKGQFIKGLTPWNKGTQGIMKANSGSFKKGDNIIPLEKRFWDKVNKTRARTFEEFMSICGAKVPVTRQAGDFRYSGRTGEEKAERRANVLSKSPDPARRRQANTIRSRIKTVADREYLHCC